MEVMTNHEFFGEDVKMITWEGHDEVREIIFKNENHDSLLINKDDVVALAKDMGLIVFDKESRL